MQQDNLINRI